MAEDRLTEDISIEEAFARLEEITAVLEKPETGLGAALDIYAEGVGLIQRCKEYLQDAEKEMIMLTGQEEVQP